MVMRHVALPPWGFCCGVFCFLLTVTRPGELALLFVPRTGTQGARSRHLGSRRAVQGLRPGFRTFLQNC